MTGNPEYNDKFISTLTLSSVNYSNSGNYCCSASLAGSVSSMTDCAFVTVSGNQVDYYVYSYTRLLKFTEIRISGDYSNLIVCSTTNITCDLPGLMPSVVLWTLPWSRAMFTSC